MLRILSFAQILNFLFPVNFASKRLSFFQNIVR